jgi:hypothetical protein
MLYSRSEGTHIPQDSHRSLDDLRDLLGLLILISDRGTREVIPVCTATYIQVQSINTTDIDRRGLHAVPAGTIVKGTGYRASAAEQQYIISTRNKEQFVVLSSSSSSSITLIHNDGIPYTYLSLSLSLYQYASSGQSPHIISSLRSYFTSN